MQYLIIIGGLAAAGFLFFALMLAKAAAKPVPVPVTTVGPTPAKPVDPDIAQDILERELDQTGRGA